MSLNLTNISRHYGAVKAVDDVSLTIEQGEFFALLGGSGCGKTTLMRMIAGLEQPLSGHISLDKVDITTAAAHHRPINMMFQSYALFPHLSVADNITFGLRYDNLTRQECDARLSEMLSLTKLKGFERRKPSELSGGQRQRVALARALAKRPKLLLLDEPLSALDKGLREATQSELKALQRETGVTFIVVTHDQDEALTLADRIGVMDKGKIVQIGSPLQIYQQPQSRFVASFLGRINTLGDVSFRSEHIVLGAEGFSGVLEAIHFKGERQELVIRLRDEAIIAYASVSQSFQLGQKLTFKVENEHLLRFTL